MRRVPKRGQPDIVGLIAQHPRRIAMMQPEANPIIWTRFILHYPYAYAVITSAGSTQSTCLVKTVGSTNRSAYTVKIGAVRHETLASIDASLSREKISNLSVDASVYISSDTQQARKGARQHYGEAAHRYAPDAHYPSASTRDIARIPSGDSHFCLNSFIYRLYIYRMLMFVKRASLFA